MTSTKLVQGVTWTALGIPINASTFQVSHGPLGRCLSVSLSLCLSVCLSYVSLPSPGFFVSGVDRVPVLGIKKPVAQNVLQPYPRTPNFNVEVVGSRVYTGQGE